MTAFKDLRNYDSTLPFSMFLYFEIQCKLHSQDLTRFSRETEAFDLLSFPHSMQCSHKRRASFWEPATHPLYLL